MPETSTDRDLRCTLGRGALPRLIYRLGRRAATGVLTCTMPTARGTRPEVFVLRRGAALCGDGERGTRALTARLVRLAGEPSLAVTFEAGAAACPPGAMQQVALAAWVRAHLEAQLDTELAEALVRSLTGRRMSLVAELAPPPVDEADRRIVAALAQPRRLDEIWAAARTPRFRLLAFLHFARSVGALVDDAAPRHEAASEPSSRHKSSRHRAASDKSGPIPASGPIALDPRAAARRLLGVAASDDIETIKRAYRRIARSLHPDLQPGLDELRRRSLERRFAEVTAAYEVLV